MNLFHGLKKKKKIRCSYHYTEQFTLGGVTVSVRAIRISNGDLPVSDTELFETLGALDETLARRFTHAATATYMTYISWISGYRYLISDTSWDI